MKKKLLALTCILAALLLVFSACGGSSDEYDDDEEEDEDEETVETTEETSGGDETTAPEESKPDDKVPVVDNTPDAPDVTVSDTLQQLQTVAKDKGIYTTSSGGIIYVDYNTKKQGIISLDGKQDSGAVYYRVDDVGDYFQVTLEQPSDPQNIDALNKTGLVDGNGKVLIPAEYAVIDELTNDGSYFKVIKATERTDSKDDMLVYLTSNMFSTSAAEGDTYYKGVWYIYDVAAGKVVDGISGTKGSNVNVFGDAITYTDDAGQNMKANVRGEAFPAGAKLVGGGYYCLDTTYGVYNALGQMMFEYKDGGSLTYDETSGYFIVGKYTNGTNEYKVLDLSGRIVASGLNKCPHVYGQDIMIHDGILCDFAGNQLLSETVDSVMQYGPFWYVRNYTTKKFYLLNENREVIFTGDGNQGDYFRSVDGIVERETDQGKRFYCFATGNFEYEGNVVGSGYISVKNDDNTIKLVNTHTGEVVLDGYTRYALDVAKADGAVYIFASNSVGTTVYKVK